MLGNIERRATGEVKDTVKLVERATLRMAESVMRSYTSAQQALLDLIDNAVDNRIEGKQLSVGVGIKRDSISLTNVGGEGLDLEGLSTYLQWGVSTKTGWQIGQYGIGGKAAAGFLGKSIEIRCSPRDSGQEYRLYDREWEKKGEGDIKEHECEIRDTYTKDGYFRIVVTNLTRAKSIDANSVIAKLRNIYNPLLERGEVKMQVNGQEVRPIEVKYLTSEDGKPLRQVYLVEDALSHHFPLTVGILAEGEQGKIKPGIRCYYRGRLIEEGQFWGVSDPSQNPRAARLIGEVNLDFLEVNLNKTGFIKEGQSWEETQKAIHRVLTPWMERLENLKTETPNQIESYERELIKQAKRIFEGILASTRILTKDILPGQSYGRLSPIPKGNIFPKPPPGKPRKPGEIEGATPPAHGAIIGGPNVKRWGALYDWESIMMGTPTERSVIIETNGRPYLKVNVDYPLYQAAKRAGDTALQIYILETAVIAIAGKLGEEKGWSLKEYIEWTNESLQYVGEFFKNRMQFKSRRSDNTTR